MNSNILNFITFEGIDGVGKTTQAIKLVEYLKSLGKEVISTREPGGVDSAEKIRELVLNNDFLSLTQVLLFQAARIEHIHKVILPNIKTGKIVVCDRFLDSTIVYQGRKVDENIINDMHSLTTGNFLPQLTFLLIADVKNSLFRISSREEENNSFDRMKYNDFEDIQNRFLILAKKFPDRIHIINANASPDEVFEEIKKIIDKYI